MTVSQHDARLLPAARGALAFALQKCCLSPLPSELGVDSAPHVEAAACAGGGCYTLVNGDGSRHARTTVDEVGYTLLFTAEALVELWAVTAEAGGGDVAWWEAYGLVCGMEFVRAFLARVDDPARCVEETYYRQNPPQPGTRTLGYTFVPLRVCTNALRLASSLKRGGGWTPSEKEVLALQYAEEVAGRCMTEMDRFHDADTGLTRELLAHGWAPLVGANGEFYYLSHALEALWMAMVRRRHGVKLPKRV